MGRMSDWDRFNEQFREGDEECQRCHGDGKIHWLKLHAHGPELDTDKNGYVDCPRCGGTGVA